MAQIQMNHVGREEAPELPGGERRAVVAQGQACGLPAQHRQQQQQAQPEQQPGPGGRRN